MFEKKMELTESQKAEAKRQWTILSKGANEIIPEDAFREKIAESLYFNRPLRVKLGLDPTAPDIHMGHTVVLQKLKQFQLLGHQIQLVIGDFTGRIGDPTGKSETRRQLTEEDVNRNAETYRKQIYKILDPVKTEVFFNSRWLAQLNLVDVVQLSSKVTVARMLERDDFSKRYVNGLPIHIHEFLYSLLTGYDSIALESDIEIGGTDQKFNFLIGRALQKEYGKATQAIMTMPLLEGLDGVQKMSKSLGNYIGINEAPNEIYGKVMSIPDGLMIKYYELLTAMTEDELSLLKTNLSNGSAHPRDLKMRLAKLLAAQFHSEEAALDAEQHFISVFQQKSLPQEISEAELPTDELAENGSIRLAKLLVSLRLQTSLSEAKRSIQGGAVSINEQKMLDPNAEVEVRNGDIVQVGKRKFSRIKFII
jgi:tyrosyl-tRNA synthetase